MHQADLNKTKVLSGKSKIGSIILHLTLSCIGLFVIMPFAWMVLTSIKETADIFAIPPVLFSAHPKWSNYVNAFTQLPFGGAYLNSFKISITVVIFSLITSSMAGFAFAKLRFPGKNLIFFVLLCTMMIPFQVIMIPLFIIMKYLGLLDNHLSLIIPGSLFNAFAVFLLRQFIKGIPSEIEESAVIDGCNYWQIYSWIIMPLIKPGLAALGIFTFMSSWNSFTAPLIFLNSMGKFPVPLLINQFKGYNYANIGLMMAAASIAIIPVLIVFIVGQKYIIEGITLTGLKA